MNCILNHRAIRVPFEEIRQKFGIRHGLQQRCETRFATNVIMLQSLSENQLPLVEVVYKHKDVWTALKSDIKQLVQEPIKNDTFWESVEAVLKLLKPVADLIYSSESNQAYVECTYLNWLELKKHFESIELNGFITRTQLIETFTKRWNFIHVPVHGFAFVLNPLMLGRFSLGRRKPTCQLLLKVESFRLLQ